MSSLVYELGAATGLRSEALLSCFEELRVGQGEALACQGDLVDDLALFVLLDGQLRVTAQAPRDGFSVDKEIGRGAVVGILGALDGSRTAGLVASCDARLAVMRQRDFERLVCRRDPVGLELLEWLARQLVADLRHLESVLCEAAASRAC